MQVMLREAQRPDAIKLHALGFGKDVDAQFMAKIAKIGGGSFHTISEINDIGR